MLSANEHYVRLTPAFMRIFTTHSRGWPQQVPYKAYCRAKYGSGSYERWLGQLKQGQPVPYRAACALLGYVTEHWKRDEWAQGWTEATAFERAERSYEELDGNWASTETMFGTVARHFQCTDEMCSREGDAEFAAGLTMAWVGRNALTKDGRRPDYTSCLQRGEIEMQRSYQEFATWIAGMVAWNPATLMFPVVRVRGHREYKRIGASLVLPLNESAYRRFCRGELADKDLTPDDLVYPSPYLCEVALTQLALPPELSAREVSIAEIHCVLYQMAFLSWKVCPDRPIVVTFAPNAHYLDRLHRLGFRETGAKMRGFELPILRLRYPTHKDQGVLGAWFNYSLTRLSLRLYQRANIVQWEAES